MSAPDTTEPVTDPRAPAPRLKLVVVSGPDFGKELVLEPGRTYRVGKDETAELPLSDNAVSRVHLTVELLPQGPRITDPGSTNGSFCEGMRFTQVEARVNAVFEIGRTQLKVLPVTQPAPSLPPSSKGRFHGLIGSSLVMRQLFALLERVAATDADIYIHGETGTGKELCARAIHEGSPRAKAPFVVCDLAGIAPTLFESELFGHVKGSFTGALQDRPGAFERAHSGTLFLDEVGELSAELQPRLLRFLESREVKRVGSNDYRKVDVRVVLATHRDLLAEAQAGRFREDLYHRLQVTVRLPPLRERVEDIPELIDDILGRLGKQPSELAPETRALLAGHSWPGNVRELRNVVERVVFTGEQPAGADVTRPSGSPALPFKEAKERLVNAFERDYLQSLLARAQHNVTQAARDAGLDRVHLYRLLKKHGLGER